MTRPMKYLLYLFIYILLEVGDSSLNYVALKGGMIN